MIYTIEELNEDISIFFKNQINIDDPYKGLFELLYYEGLRINEVINSSSWYKNDKGYFVVPLSKNQSFRTLNLYPGNTKLYESLINNNEFFYYVNNTTASSYYKTYFPKLTYLNDSKSITSHIFRHAFIKNLFAQGRSVIEISKYIGEINIANTTGYINSVLTYPDPVRK